MIDSVIKQDIGKIIDKNPKLIEQLSGRSFLITGATGMIGRYAVCLLGEVSKKNGGTGVIIANVRDQVKAETMFADYLGMDNFKLLVSDVNNLIKLEDQVDFVLHAASSTQPEDFLNRPVDIIKANVFATSQLLEITKQNKSRFCLLSTLEVYGKIEAPSYPARVSESDFGALDSLDLRSAYPESKRLAENLCAAYQKQFDTDVTIVRLAPVISPIVEPGDKRVYAQFVNDVSAGKDITVFSDAAGKMRSYTYIADAISGIFTALLGSTKDNFVFNLANNENVVSIKELAEKIISGSRKSTSKLTVIERTVDKNTSATTGLVLLDSKRLLNLGWSPAYSLEDGIKQTMKYKTGRQ